MNCARRSRFLAGGAYTIRSGCSRVKTVKTTCRRFLTRASRARDQTCKRVSVPGSRWRAIRNCERAERPDGRAASPGDSKNVTAFLIRNRLEFVRELFDDALAQRIRQRQDVIVDGVKRLHVVVPRL